MRVLIPDLRHPTSPPTEETYNLDREQSPEQPIRVVEDFVSGDYKKWIPAFIPVISLAQIIIFIVYAALFGNVTYNSGGIDLNSPLIFDPWRRKEVWRFFTYSMLHDGVHHLLTNVMTQLLFGTFLEIGYGFFNMGCVYLGGVAAGSLMSSMWNPRGRLAGASGGVYAMFGAHLATVLMSWGKMNAGLVWSDLNIKRMILSAQVRLFVVIVLLAMDTSYAVIKHLSGGPDEMISYAAHVGGAVTGLLLGVFFFRVSTDSFESLKPWRKVLCVVFIILYSIYVIAAIVFNVVCGSYDLCPS